MGTGNYVTTLSGRNQQSNLDKIDNWETTRKYLFDRISLYTAYSLILQIYFQRKKFQMQKFISIYVKRRDFKRNQSIVSNGKKIRNMDSVTAAEWLQCLTSKLRCCSFFSVWKVLCLLWKTPRRNFMIYFEKHQGGKGEKGPRHGDPSSQVHHQLWVTYNVLWSATSSGSVSSWSTTLWLTALNEVHHQQ